MHSVEHTLTLKDGRLLAYHTFPNAEEDEDEDEDEDDNSNKEGAISSSSSSSTEEQEQERHPVLYFHGYPSCGLEGGVTSARSVARAGGKLYAIDRPGMGKISSPYKKEKDSNSNLDTFVENVWELVEDQGWKEFSILGVSGGGPYILAVVASYLQRMETQKQQQQQQQDQSSDKNSNSNSNNNKTKSRLLPVLPLVPHLRNVCLVCAVCMSATAAGSSSSEDGSENGSKNNISSGLESMNALVESASTSRRSRFWLHTSALAHGIMNNYLIPLLPISWLANMMTNNNGADQQWLYNNNNNNNDGKNNNYKYLSNYLVARKSMAVQQGTLLSSYPGIYDDTLIVLRAHHSHEDILSQYYSNNDDDDDDDNDNDLLPAVGIFQGTSDSNVPLSHAHYMHTAIFHEHARSTLILYQNLGHISTIATKSEDFAAFVTTTTTTTTIK